MFVQRKLMLENFVRIVSCANLIYPVKVGTPEKLWRLTLDAKSYT